MSKLRPPEELSFGDAHALADQWRMWSQEMRLYLSLAMGKDTEKDKCAAFLYIIGRKGREIYNTWTLMEDEQDKIDVLFQKFELYCKPKHNLTLERYKFNSRVQQENETLDEFVTELTRLAKQCNYTTLESDMIRDRIVVGIKRPEVKDRLLREPELTLEKAMSICRADEESRRGLNLMTTGSLDSSASIQAVRTEHRRGQKKHPTSTKEKIQKRQCPKCGTTHEPRCCPAYNKTCNKCKKQNHFAKMCRTAQKKVHEVNTQVFADVTHEDYYVGMIHIQEVESGSKNNMQQAGHEWSVVLNIRGQNVKAKIDTGAQANVMSVTTANKIHAKVAPSSARLSTYSGTKIPVAGEVNLPCFYNNKKHMIKYIVTTAEHAQTILGLETSTTLQLIQRVEEVTTANGMSDLVREFEDTFGDLGCFKETHHINIDKDVDPAITPPRRVPLGLRSKLKEKLEVMERQEVITKVDEPTAWVNPMILVQKPNGDIRICIDPQQLNKAINREHFQLPTLEELTIEMKGAQYFTKLDASSGFWQIPLDEPSSKLCTFATPFGRYRFKRLPFGIKSAPEVFQKIIHKHFGDIPGVVNYEDDICVWSSTLEEHKDRLRKVLMRARECGLKFNMAKCEFAKPTLKYLGHILTKEGLKVDESKVTAIKNMPSPQTKKELMRFLGMVTYLTKFLPNMSESTAPLRELLEKDCEWLWLPHHEEAVKKIKDILTNTPVLAYFDVTKPVTVTADASKNGLGAALLQNDKPIAYASRSLTKTEQRYAMIEKETLAIVFAMERFHQYVYGKTVKIESDHKPLVAIQHKPFNNCPARIQRFLLRLQKYDYVIHYKKGNDQVLSDTLSRAVETKDHIQTEIPQDEVSAMVSLVDNMTELSNDDPTMKRILEAQQHDGECQLLRTMIQEGWPETFKSTSAPVKPYWTFKEEIVENDEGLLMKGTQIIIPRALRQDMLKRIHEGHLGIQMSIQRARESVYWPNMNKQIEECIKTCATCQKHRNAQNKETLKSHSVPEVPFEKIGADLFTFGQKNYLLIVDYSTKFFECSLLNNTTSSTVISSMKSIFSRHGIPKVLMTDNGPQFASREFRQFTSDWEIRHITSSPLYPQSNGMIERTVQTVKNLLKKARESNEDPYLAILNFRTTPKQDQKSPAELLMGRKLRTLLPTGSKSNPVRPYCVTADNQAKQAARYNVNAKDLKQLKQGQFVRYRHQGVWEPAQVLHKLSARSYLIKTRRGSLRRNRRDLLESAETFIRLNPEPLEVEVDPVRPSTIAQRREMDSLPTNQIEPQTSSDQADVPDSAMVTGSSVTAPHNTTMHYTTRSGRVVKAPKKLTM